MSTEDIVPEDAARSAPPIVSDEWQSFELHMRRRRAVRCRMRAELALDAGLVEDARAAFDEARVLDPAAPQLACIDERLTRAQACCESPATSMNASNPPPFISASVFSVSVVVVALAWLAITPPYRSTPHGDTGLLPSATTAIARSTPSRVVVEHIQVPADAVRGLPARGELSGETESLLLVQSTQAPFGATSPELLTREVATTGGEPSSGRSEVPISEAPSTASSEVPTLRAADATNQPAPDGASAGIPEPASRRVLDLPIVEPAAVAGAVPAADVTAIPAMPRATQVRTVSGPPEREDLRVRAVLERFEAAYSALDPLAAQSVWPGVDGRALARAFDSLESQRISLGRCDIDVAGASARANCSGTAAWTPKVGGGLRTEARRWTFELSSAEGDWQIVHARVQ